jgi:beta-glucosidase
MTFPQKFLWGTATSAAQIEGGAFEDGRTASIWDTFSKEQGKIYNQETPTIACDSYHRYMRDINNLVKLGVDSYRFSISWSRVMPNGTGRINPKGLDYYKKLIEQLHKNNITPNVTLYHWDLPQVLEDKGGWVNRDVIEWYGEYAYNMFKELGDSVQMWSTINEPIATYVGYGLGGFAPGYVNELAGNQARHNILVAHGKGIEAFRSFGFKDSKIGIVIDIWKRHALTSSLEDKQMIIDEDERNWKFYTDPVFTGHYSDYIISKLEKEGTLMNIVEGDLKLISQQIDYFGLNVYNRVVVSADKKAVQDFSQGGNFLNNDTEYYPKAVYDAVHLLHELYNIKIPIYITENGTYFKGIEKVNSNTNMIEDEDKIKYVKGYLEWLEKAIDEGIDIRGYYLWSLMDNFEWTAGSNFRFGIIHTDFESQEQTWKKSAYWYRDFIAATKKKNI